LKTAPKAANIVNADSIGVNSLRLTSSVANLLQCVRKLDIADRAPALFSSVICHVNASPRAFSDSSSFEERGNEFFQSNNILGSNPLTTGGPNVITAPINSQPACVRCNDKRLFCDALLNEFKVLNYYSTHILYDCFSLLSKSRKKLREKQMSFVFIFRVLFFLNGKKVCYCTGY
jgi:hypothetical protein